jgi:hypothetical protein
LKISFFVPFIHISISPPSGDQKKSRNVSVRDWLGLKDYISKAKLDWFGSG